MKNILNPVATFGCEIDRKRCLLRWEDDGGAAAPATDAAAFEENPERRHANHDHTRLGLHRRSSRRPDGSHRRA